MGYKRGVADVLVITTYASRLALPLRGSLTPPPDGRGVTVFACLSLPAVVAHLPHQSDIAGNIHLYLAVALIVIAAVHAAADSGEALAAVETRDQVVQ